MTCIKGELFFCALPICNQSIGRSLYEPAIPERLAILRPQFSFFSSVGWLSLTFARQSYKSDSDYVKDTIPVLSTDQRVVRFEGVKFKKVGVDESIMLKSLSDGEHQLLHTLGLCLLFKNTSSLFLLDEPETHFNPDWRSKFITRLSECFKDSSDTAEMIITTHAPFLDLRYDSRRDARSRTGVGIERTIGSVQLPQESISREP